MPKIFSRGTMYEDFDVRGAYSFLVDENNSPKYSEKNLPCVE